MRRTSVLIRLAVDHTAEAAGDFQDSATHLLEGLAGYAGVVAVNVQAIDHGSVELPEADTPPPRGPEPGEPVPET